MVWRVRVDYTDAKRARFTSVGEFETLRSARAFIDGVIVGHTLNSYKITRLR